jgi:hypothetical protein
VNLKLGTENPKKVAAAVVLLLIGIFFVIRGLNPSNEGNSASAPPPGQPVMGKRAQLLPENNLDPRLRLDLLKNSEDVEYKGNGRNIFRAGAEPVKEIPKPVTPPMAGGTAAAAASTGPPPPPPITLKFFGFSKRQGEENKIFLAQGDDVFVAREGDIVDRRYRILHISPTSVEVEDVLSNVRQTLPLTQG